MADTLQGRWTQLVDGSRNSELPIRSPDFVRTIS
jgi:hypothetical protein